MTRKTLRDEIQCVNQRLNLHRQAFNRANAQAMSGLKKHPPLLMIATGLLAGAATGTMGWHKVYRVSKAGFSFFPLLKVAANYLQGISHD